MLHISIGSDILRQWLSKVLRICGDLLFSLHLKRLSYYAYSAIHNINYFAGIRDEMGGVQEFIRELQNGRLSHGSDHRANENLSRTG